MSGYANRHFLVREGDGEYTTAEVDPTEVLDFGFDWSRVLRGDTIDTSTWVLHGGQTEDQASSVSGAKTTVWPIGGDSGGEFPVTLACTNKIVTTGGRTYERTFWRRVRQVHPAE